MEATKYYCERCGQEVRYGDLRKVKFDFGDGPMYLPVEICKGCLEDIKKPIMTILLARPGEVIIHKSGSEIGAPESCVECEHCKVENTEYFVQIADCELTGKRLSERTKYFRDDDCPLMK